MPRVLHTAQALVDVVIEVPELPPRGGNTNAISEQRYAGGAVTTLLAAARTGARAVHGGAHGIGPNGDLIRSRLAAEGIELSDTLREGADTGYCMVLVEPTAERSFVTVYGAERQITADSLATLDAQPGDLLCLSGYSLFEPTRRPLLEYLESLPDGVEVVLDPGAPFAGFPQQVQDRVLARTTVWTSNAEEARAFTGLDALQDTPEALRRRIGSHAVVVVRDGMRGCTVFHHGRGTEIPAFPQEAVDTNGAGDTHTGVLLAERALGADWESAATRANAAAAIAVTRWGTEGAPGRAEVDEFLS
ncbi:MAG TPA: bifunctional hydroxymethylpyrimidine kinase/phosphomethylpyrimidine kinase [Candidatus Brachybacterium merdavium]|uniref:Bifunctional hydroxymethylpyrimidine kinase/phosphomethylpyrimidine kinase n=1 Tax=Candidatus Brachybacterium merdavium TaxID=2838513 RepID=A0A9D2RM49_9MICO|nr:bifunctional hydroxymethylpyrimidine kinase/phosphomethylpyrimidine kinase [Candidatus Brachybacterium merdavium]